MGQTNCPGCGATVDVVIDVTTGERVALDPNTSNDTDVQRYVYVSPHAEVSPVPLGMQGYYFRAHECIEPPAA